VFVLCNGKRLEAVLINVATARTVVVFMGRLPGAAEIYDIGWNRRRWEVFSLLPWYNAKRYELLWCGKETTMPDAINLDQKLELRGPSGQTIGFFLAENTLRDLLAEQDRLRRELARLQQAHKELAHQRDSFCAALQALTEQYLPFIEKDLEELKQTGVPFDLLIQEVDKVAAEHSRTNQNGT
jgi:hypothetical protein